MLLAFPISFLNMVPALLNRSDALHAHNVTFIISKVNSISAQNRDKHLDMKNMHKKVKQYFVKLKGRY
jgi:hypothetical protein